MQVAAIGRSRQLSKSFIRKRAISFEQAGREGRKRFIRFQKASPNSRSGRNGDRSHVARVSNPLREAEWTSAPGQRFAKRVSYIEAAITMTPPQTVLRFGTSLRTRNPTAIP